jgi:hypothetical protein
MFPSQDSRGLTLSCAIRCRNVLPDWQDATMAQLTHSFTLNEDSNHFKAPTYLWLALLARGRHGA